MRKMDVDNENLYDEISSLMPETGDFSLEDLDEIIRSTDSHFDASLDINVFENNFNQNDFDITATVQNELVVTEKNNIEQLQAQQQNQQSLESQLRQTTLENDFNFDFTPFSSPATSHQSVSPPYEIPVHAISTTSIDGDNFNPDDFINFLNEDDVKVDNLSCDTNMNLNGNCRNTPSPTGSCTSSCGSSTSGIQSDASSIVSMSQSYKSPMTQEQDDDISEFITFKNEKADGDIKMNDDNAALEEQFDRTNSIISTTPTKENSKEMQATAVCTSTTLVPITLPVLPVTTIQPVQPVNFVQGTIIPVQTVETITPVINCKTPAIKSDNKPALNKPVSQSEKVVTNPANLSPSSKVTNASGSPKITPPPNAKPKTIFLSSNDFNALMQKINANGTKLTGVNGQTPKIIMKTAKGKVITANKLTNPIGNNTLSVLSSSLSSSNSSNSPLKFQSLPFVTKPVKTNESMIIKQQQPSKVVVSNARSAAVMASTRANMSCSRSVRTDLGIIKGVNDDKLLKKQMRMLKNRESASLSRKKKKEYVEKLENRINDLEKENYSLKGENSSLRSQLMAFAQTCNCKNGNVSEFILNTLKMDGKLSGGDLSAIGKSYIMNNANSSQHFDDWESATNNSNGITETKTSTTHHVKIAPKPPNAGPLIHKSIKQRMNATAVKKNVAILFAMAFMVTMNVGNFQSYLNKSALENAIEASALDVTDESVGRTGRQLLWVPNEHELNERTNRSKREIEITNIPPPPPLHFLYPINRKTADKMNGTSAKDEPSTTSTTYKNSTQENMRLARNLHKWIGGNDFLNLTGNGNYYKHMAQFKFVSGTYMDYDLPLQAPVGTQHKRKIILDSETAGKQAKLTVDDHNSLDIFKPRISEEYLRLFKGIKRQDDTFYVLSFNMDHILLPASAYNKSSRPKMSLMLPSGDPSVNGDIVLMQIDCEVINTTELEIKSNMIPEKLRPSKYTTNARVNPNDSSTATKSNKIHLKREELKEKPSGPRTYFMMEPKNQSSSATANSISNGSIAIKKKPSIFKLNANASVIGSGVLNLRNSTFISRMRETADSRNNSFIAATAVKNNFKRE